MEKLEKYGVQEMNAVDLDSNELILIQGGAELPKWLRKTFWGAALYEIVTNWEAAKAGARDGWNGKYNNKY